MMERFRKLYEQKLSLKITTVVLVVLLSMGFMLPVVIIAEYFGINLRENVGLKMKVDLPNILFFLLFIAGTTLIISGAQKYIHKEKLFDLGFRTKVFSLLIIGFLFGVIQSVLGYLIMGLNAEQVTFTDVIPEDVQILSYIGYYFYFIFGFLFLNSYIEELVTRAYPIEKLRKYINPHIIFIVMGVIFTAGHFISRDFNLGYCLSLFIYSYTLSLVYFYSKSIWLVIGLHSGLNWVAFSFFNVNWRTGGITHISIADMTPWVAYYTQPIIGILALLFVVLLQKKGFYEKMCS